MHISNAFNSPLFVTWNKKNTNKYYLRGCIGTFSPQSLHKALASYAITSAFKDTRFDPVHVSELEHLKCSVSILVHFEDAEHIYDWEIGKHGIRISFEDPRSERELGATYLPEVCAEQGWTKQECLESLYRKAGYSRRITQELMESTTLERYQSSKCHMTYDEYAQKFAITD
jgi:uncharacterized protein (TIGR00296 family)